MRMSKKTDPWTSLKEGGGPQVIPSERKAIQKTQNKKKEKKREKGGL